MEQRLYNIPPSEPFLKILAGHLFEKAKGDPLALRSCLIFLPTRRACRVLTAELSALHHHRPFILPTLVAISNPPETLLDLHRSEDLKPELPFFRRYGLLTQLIQKQKNSLSEAEGEGVVKSLEFASSLIELMDEIENEAGNLENLEKIVPEMYADHWQDTLAFLKIISQHWPTILEEQGFMTLSQRRNLVFKKLVEQWNEAPPSYPVIAAGLNGSLPYVQDLLYKIKSLGQGLVLLAGLDQFIIDDNRWILLTPLHPQYQFKKLLKKLNVSRKEIPLWPMAKQAFSATPSLVAREELVSLSMQEGELVSSKAEALIDQGALDKLELIECSSLHEEAAVIALILRSVVEDPLKTAALITPDRRLAKQVQAILKRWNLTLDDSGGTKLSKTPLGTFLELTAKLLFSKFDVITFLSLLKHPYTCCGLYPSEFKNLARVFERDVLRGRYVGNDLLTLQEFVQSLSLKSQAECSMLMTLIMDALGESLQNEEENSLTLETLVKRHLRFSESLSRRKNEESFSLWQVPYGEHLKPLIEDLLKDAAFFPNDLCRDYPEVFKFFLDKHLGRLVYDSHPRLFVWGPLEARLQTADVIILGGVNEGQWPNLQKEDPWLNHLMRKSLGLPSADQPIGFLAYDFSQFIGGKEVYLTRSLREEGNPTLSSRWLVRLQALLKAAKKELSLGTTKPWVLWAEELQKPQHKKTFPRPRPAPPLKARPLRLSVTEVDFLTQNPYIIYITRILKLRPLSSLGFDLDNAFFGTLIHKIMDQYMHCTRRQGYEKNLSVLKDIGAGFFAPYKDHPFALNFWWPRFEKIAHDFLSLEEDLGRLPKKVLTEVAGELKFNLESGEFKLTGKADRIDILPDNTCVIIDYKTGKIPSLREIQEGRALQLLLEGAIALKGRFEGLGSCFVKELEYWHLKTNSDEKILKLESPQEFIEKALKRLKEMLARFDKEGTVYSYAAVLSKKNKFDPYEHFSRIKEWLASTY
jgi:ATP-dependent helicase/nuclease subunit B